MRPVIALIGRPNVGKSTLFNQLTRSRDALVADQPGLTRDRKYGSGEYAGRKFIVIDTGGMGNEDDGLEALMAEQARRAVEEASIVFFLVDAHAGVLAGDQNIAAFVRTHGKRCWLVVNKIDGIDADYARAEFYRLGLGDPQLVAATHGQGVRALLENALQEVEPAADDEAQSGDDAIKVAVVGRPNVGKSTLVNRMLGEERVLVFDMPGTTRDSIYVPFNRDQQNYVLIDTAGVRRRRNIEEAVEKFSIVKALQAIQDAHVVIMVLDARQEISHQDAHLLGYIMDEGRALLVAVNKWDGLPPEQRDFIKKELERKLPYLDFAAIHFISALHGSGVGDLFASIRQAHAAAFSDFSTPQLTRILEQAVADHQPPLVRGRRVKLRYAHQGGKNPPIIVIHGNQTEHLPDAYKRYLISTFRQVLHLQGTPVRIEFKTGRNPYQGRKNKLTPRQQQRRKRMLRHLKKNK